MKKNITCFIVSKNEGHLLDAALQSVSFCNELIVIDLNSTDDTAAIARRHEAKHIVIDPLPIVELIHQKYIHHATNDWVLLLDPDEVLSEKLQEDLLNSYADFSAHEKYSTVIVPTVLHFKGKALTYTKWGGVKTKPLLIHQQRAALNGAVHRSALPKEGFDIYYIPYAQDNIVKHYWMQSYSQLISKHSRYLKHEGKSRFEAGKRTRLLKVGYLFLNEFYVNYIHYRGYKGFARGLFLSVFRAWYFGSAELKLYLYQKQNQA